MTYAIITDEIVSTALAKWFCRKTISARLLDCYADDMRAALESVAEDIAKAESEATACAIQSLYASHADYQRPQITLEQILEAIRSRSNKEPA